MGQIIAAIRAAISAIIAIVWVPCRITGRLIRQIQRSAAGPSIPSVDVPPHRSVRRPSNGNARQAVEPTGSAMAVKQLAQRMAAGTVTMANMHEVPADVVKWMSSLDHQQLCRLICIEDLRGYMNRRIEVRGLPPYLQMPPRPSERRTADRDMAYTPIAAPAI